MPRPSHLSTDNILRFLQLRNDPVSIEDLSRALHVKKGNRRPSSRCSPTPDSRPRRGTFPRALPSPPLATRSRPRSRTRSEKIVQQKAASRDEIKGRLVLHQDGYGFVVPVSPFPMWLATFSFRATPSKTHARRSRRREDQPLSGHSGARRAEGRIVRIVGRAHPSIVGQSATPRAAVSLRRLTRASSMTSSL